MGVMDEGWSSRRGTTRLQEAAASGMLFEAHVKFCPPTVADVAVFLLGAGKNAYLGCGPWYEQPDNQGGPYWFGDFYDRPLGKPLGNATINGKVWSRSFAHGTNVTVDFNDGNISATIHWGDGHTHTTH